MNNGFPLVDYNTFKIQSHCREIHFIREEKELIDFYGMNAEDFRILGGGSNIVMMEYLDKIILKNEIKSKEIIHEDQQSVTIRIGGGETWHEFVLWTIEQGYSGIENLSLIPGTVGAAPVQNIGAYGVELDEVFVRLEGINLVSGQLVGMNKIACQFGYRDSIFKHELKEVFFITYVHLKLNKKFVPRIEYGDIKESLNKLEIFNPTAKDISNAVVSIRQSKLPDPKKIGNAGSFFKNAYIAKTEFDVLIEKFPNLPHYSTDTELIKIPSAWLIEQCGWKGKRLGNAACHEKQALVLVNKGNTTGKEVLNLANAIMEDVLQMFGIQLTVEVNVWN
ncbi:MAG: UDP-N-acetylmuramate dehydrogenase [Saprospiraceae bacterium]